MRTVSLWLHIVGAGTWLGANLLQVAIGPRLVKSKEAALPWLKAVESASGPLYGGASLLIIITGVHLVLSSSAYSFGSGFVGVGMAAVLIGGALAGLVFARRTRLMIGHLERGEYQAVAPIYRSVGAWAGLDTAVVLTAILAMVAKWGA